MLVWPICCSSMVNTMPTYYCNAVALMLYQVLQHVGVGLQQNGISTSMFLKLMLSVLGMLLRVLIIWIAYTVYTSLFDNDFILILSLEGRGSEVQLLPGDHDAEAGALDEAGSNRKTMTELLALDPHDSNVFSYSPTWYTYSCMPQY